MKKYDVGYVFNEGRCLVLSLLAVFPLLSCALSAQTSDIAENVQIIERRLPNYKGPLEFGAIAAANVLVQHGDLCVDPVVDFMRRKGYESLRMGIGLDVLFRVNSDKSLAAISKLFSANYGALTNNLSSVHSFAYQIAREAILRDSGVARQIVELIQGEDALYVALKDAFRILRGSGQTLPEKLSLQVEPDYYVVGLFPFLPHIYKRIANDEKLLEEFRSWYLSVLVSDVLDRGEFARMVVAIEKADCFYLYDDEFLGKLITRLEKDGKKWHSDLLKRNKSYFDGSGDGGSK